MLLSKDRAASRKEKSFLPYVEMKHSWWETGVHSLLHYERKKWHSLVQAATTTGLET